MAKHNVDLSSLSLAQIDQLLTEAAVAKEQLEAKQHEEAVKKTKGSGDFQALKDEYKALKQLAKGIESKYTFKLMLPIVVQVNSECYLDDLKHYDEIREDGIFSIWFSGKIDKDCNLTAKQYKILNEQVQSNLQDACDDFLGVVPDEYRGKLKEFTERANALIKNARKLKLKVSDL